MAKKVVDYVLTLDQVLDLKAWGMTWREILQPGLEISDLNFRIFDGNYHHTRQRDIVLCVEYLCCWPRIRKNVEFDAVMTKIKCRYQKCMSCSNKTKATKGGRAKAAARRAALKSGPVPQRPDYNPPFNEAMALMGGRKK